MNPDTPHLSQHRTRRLARWAALWLEWMRGVLAFLTEHELMSRQVRAVAHEWIGRVAYFIAMLIAGQAAMQTKPRACIQGGRPRKQRSAFMRAIIGARLRVALRHRDPATRLARLAAVLRAMPYWIRQNARRLHCGLTRGAPSPWSAGALAGKTLAVAPLRAGKAPALHRFADTS